MRVLVVFSFFSDSGRTSDFPNLRLTRRRVCSLLSSLRTHKFASCDTARAYRSPVGRVLPSHRGMYDRSTCRVKKCHSSGHLSSLDRRGHHGPISRTNSSGRGRLTLSHEDPGRPCCHSPTDVLTNPSTTVYTSASKSVLTWQP
ncbi:hypothetical protein L227DRAFT_281552 [Lentinus tigrinus ALCF2SS1-6]|uniref:Uncharacterized protein n=1 Tax=Lentinus tigrinus ALCF2SS1-6 TaxID=1328759 RepID=A0A5C2RYX6_9APHY|nr:hypothetical protein L227DRAFT_281552 [Lentinus tigrinus ALCF2SS1-6]